MTQVVIGDLRTGDIFDTLPVTTMAWTKNRNAAETIRCSVPLSSRLTRKLDLRNTTSPAKTFLAVIEYDTVMAAGPIWRRTFTDATKSLQLSAAGLWSYFDHRVIIPLLADSVNLIDATTGESLAAANTTFVNLSYGTMAKRLVQQARTWTGGDLPIAFLPDEVGTFTKEYLGANVKFVGEALRDFTNLVNGVDIDFFARRNGTSKIEWLLRTGTISAPDLRGPTVHFWDYTVQRPSLRNLVAVDDASGMTGQAWTLGGRQNGSVVIERVINHSLVSAGYPLLESVDSSHPDASDPSLLRSYSGQEIKLGAAPEEIWTFEAKADADPKVGTYFAGDDAQLKVKGNVWIPDGDHDREIASLGGDHIGKWIKVATQEKIRA